MQQALTAFLARETDDKLDNLAKRAIRALDTLSSLMRNAYDRGLPVAFDDCQTAHAYALYAFTAINTRRRYVFASTVDDCVPDLTINSADIADPEKAASDLLQRPEAAIAFYKDQLTPVCKVSGITSVAILRGAHCLASVAGLNPANAN